MEKNWYDIAIVGSGISCSRTICELAERLRNKPALNQMVRIAIIERESELWNGVPYGRRSAVGALAFQKLQEFLDEPERSSYIEWLETNEDLWIKIFKERGGRGAEQWILDNQLSMRHGNWCELYLPRFLFGMYVSSKAERSVKQLAEAGLASVTPIYGEATAVSRTLNGLHAIVVEGKDGSSNTVKATRIVLAMGSPPQKSVFVGADGGDQKLGMIDNMYSPSTEASIERIRRTFVEMHDKSMANLLVVGSNASSLEVLYLIAHRPEIRDLINSVVVLSRSGKLPYRISEQVIDFETTALNLLLESRGFSATDLMAAIRCDVQRAEELQLNIADLRDIVGSAVTHLTALMPSSEQRKFVCEHGVHFSRMMRRAGRDTREAADQLVNGGLVTVVKGELVRLEPSSSASGLMSAIFLPEECQVEMIYPSPFSVIVNCGGFEDLDLSSSRLINSLIVNNICKVNSTNRGFVVNERLEASKDVYVIGPLLGGNFNDKFRFWHVESASRIVGLAKMLADSLNDSLVQSREYLSLDSPRSSTLMTSTITSG